MGFWKERDSCAENVYGSYEKVFERQWDDKVNFFRHHDVLPLRHFGISRRIYFSAFQGISRMRRNFNSIIFPSEERSIILMRDSILNFVHKKKNHHKINQQKTLRNPGMKSNCIELILNFSKRAAVLFRIFFVDITTAAKKLGGGDAHLKLRCNITPKLAIKDCPSFISLS